MIFDWFNTGRLFEFEKCEGGYALTKFAQRNFFDDPSATIVTEIEIPAKYRGKPVVEIGEDAFRGAWKLQKVYVPESVRKICKSAFRSCEKLSFISLPSTLEDVGSDAFCFCRELCAVGFNSQPRLWVSVFDNDIKLPAELILAGELGAFDIAQPLANNVIHSQILKANAYPQNSWLLNRPDVLELILKNNCLCDFTAKQWFDLLAFFVEKGCAEHLRVIEDCGAINAALADELIERSAEHHKTEMTAYLLDYKNRKFGFKGGGDFEL